MGRPPGRPPKQAATTSKAQFQCCYRNHTFSRQKGNFYTTNSPLWREGNGGYFPICKNCMNELLDDYTNRFGGNKEAAMERICAKFDIYWNPEIYRMTLDKDRPGERLATYLSRSNLVKYHGKTYDDTIAEREAARLAEEEARRLRLLQGIEDKPEEVAKRKSDGVPDEVKKFWGPGFSQADYLELQASYDRWAEGRGELDVTQQSLIQNIVLAERKMRLDYQSDSKNYSQSVTAYNNLLGSANLKPVQNQRNPLLEQQTFGSLIEAWEQNKPIPEPEGEFADCDRIGEYMGIWYYGHMASVMGIEGAYCDKYNEAMDKYRVKRPTLSPDNEVAFNQIVSGDGDGDGEIDE